MALEQSAATAVQSDLAGIEEVGRLYVLQDRAQVREFLGGHPFLVPILLAARSEIAIDFPATPVVLRVVADPDTTDDSYLVVAVTTTLSADEALDRLDRFGERWWLDTVGRTQGKVYVTLAFE